MSALVTVPLSIASELSIGAVVLIAIIAILVFTLTGKSSQKHPTPWSLLMPNWSTQPQQVTGYSTPKPYSSAN